MVCVLAVGPASVSALMKQYEWSRPTLMDATSPK